jgi:exoribonuclease R
MTTKTLQRAYIKLVDNKKARTNAAKQYFQVFTEKDGGYLFTTNEMEKAAKRAKENAEDVYPVEFKEPKHKVITKEVIVEVPAKGFFAKLFGF